MLVKVVDLSNSHKGEIELDEGIFLTPYMPQIIKRVLDWQRLKSMSGCHKTKNVSEVSGTTKKPFKQKGTGNARQGSLRSAHMRGGGVPHGPKVRSHEISLPKKVRALALKSTLASKLDSSRLFVVDNINLENFKSNQLRSLTSAFDAKSIFIIDGSETVDNNFKLASRNFHNINAVPAIGANVYDIVKHDVIIISKSGIEGLNTRLL